MGASIAALSVVNLSLLHAGRIDASNPITFALLIILIILLICLAAMSLYGIYFCIKTLKELDDDEKREKEYLNSQKRAQKIAEKKCKEYENIANEILEKLNQKE